MSRLDRERDQGTFHRVAVDHPATMRDLPQRRVVAEQAESGRAPRGRGMVGRIERPRCRAGRRRAARSQIPVASKLLLAVTTERTVISLRVSVPVLSEQMTDTEPKVSTAGRRRMMALRSAMRCTPMASVIVSTAGRPLGDRSDGNANRRP